MKETLQRRRSILAESRRVLAMVLAGISAQALADNVQSDKRDYTLFNPAPDADMRNFNTDRPPKANSPYTVDAGHFQYETDIAVYGYGNSAGTHTDEWTLLDPTFKLGLTNGIDAELQLTSSRTLAPADIIPPSIFW